MTIKEHDVVVLTRDVAEHKLRAGDVGTVVHVYDGDKAYEVEFVTGSGHTWALDTFEPKDVRPRGDDETSHVRSVK